MLSLNSVNCWEPVKPPFHNMAGNGECEGLKSWGILSKSEISSQATLKKAEGSTTRGYSLNQSDMAKPPRARRFRLYITNKGDMIQPSKNERMGYIMPQGQKTKHIEFTKEILEDDYSELKSTLKIAKKYGVSKKCILNHMDKFGIDRTHRVPPVEQVRRLADAGLTASEIASFLGFTPTYIGQLARKNGFTIVDKYHKGYIVKQAGYVLIPRPNHPYCDSKGYVPEHRLVLEQHLGVYLDPKVYAVHHKNGNVQDNNLDNLELLTSRDHKRLHRRIQIENGTGPRSKRNKI